MSKILFFITIILAISLFVSCSTASKLDALKPEPDDAVPLVYENSPSFINLPVTIKLKDIEKKTKA